MPLITETYYLSLTQDNRGILRLRCSQNDTLRTANLKLYNNGSTFNIPSGISAYVSGVKQNGAVFSKSCTISQDRKSVVLPLSSDITNIDGIIIAEIVLSDGNGGRLGTSNFIIQVEKNPIRAGVIQDTETPIEYVNDFITQIQALTARVNNLITPSGDPSLAEVVDARISSLDGNTYQNLKARIDADIATLNTRKANKSEVYTKAQVDNLLDNVEIGVDDELSDESENPVQNKVVAGAISEIKADIDAIVPGLSNEAKAALLACFDNVAWKDGDGSDYIADLSDALSDDQGYIGSIAFKLSKEGSAKPSSGLSISAITNTYQFFYNASGVENRVAIDVSAFAFCAGDIISLDDTDTYAFAIGKNGSEGDYWIGGGYVSTYPFVATSADIQDMKKMLVKRNDNAVMTSEDLEYILQHITLTRSINKTLVNLLVSYDNNPVIAEEDHLAAIRHHLTVTAVYSDMTQENVTLYRISGRTLRPGANTVKIVYGSKQVSVSVTVRVIDHFLLGIAGDFGLGSWGTSAETPEENSGYIAPLSAESDKLTYNISNKTFKAGDVISLGETYVQCAFGTNLTQTSYNNRTWIGGGFLSQNTYTLQSSDISDMKILYVKHRSELSIDTPAWRTRIASRIFVQRCS